MKTSSRGRASDMGSRVTGGSGGPAGRKGLRGNDRALTRAPWSLNSVLADDVLGGAVPPDRHVHVPVADLDRGRADEVRGEEVVELPSTKVEAGLLVQVPRVALVQLRVVDVFDGAPHLGVAVGDLRVDRVSVQRELRVRQEQPELRRVRHPADPQRALEEL